MVRDDEIFVTGTGGLKDMNGEFWFHGAKRQTWQNGIGRLGETCVTVAWLHYCDAFLELSDDSTVADEMEKSFYNALLGAMHPDGHSWMHQNPTPLSGEAFRSTAKEQIPGFGGHDCCLAQGPEGIAMAPGFSFKNTGDGLVVNGYEAAECCFETPQNNKATLKVIGNYPGSGEVKLVLQLEKPETFVLKLRIPGWSGTTKISVGGKTLTPESGKYFTLEQEWGTCEEITVSFDMALRTVKDPGGSELVAYCCGPLVLAQDSRLTAGNFEEKSLCCTKVDGKILCDYAAAGNGFSPENTLRVWLEKN